jgi:hypothetical protein
MIVNLSYFLGNLYQEYINSLGHDGDFCHQGGDTEIAQKIPTKPTDMTIHWKALEEHFLMVPLFDSTISGGHMYFLTFF